TCVLLFGTVMSCATVQRRPERQTQHGATDHEEQFLACAASCLFNKNTEQERTACRKTCQTNAEVSDIRVAELPSPSIFSRRTGSVGHGGVVWFSCPVFESTCSCSGYFDCKVLDKSGCCKAPVDSCTSSGGGPETCTCDVSSKCS